MMPEQPSHIPDSKSEHTLRDQLATVWLTRHPELKELKVPAQKELRERVNAREKAVEEQDVLKTLEALGLKTGGIRQVEIPTTNQTIFSIPVSDHFAQDRLPDSYSYKGGAARALLLRSLGMDPGATPRDVDIVRTVEQEPEDGLDQKLAEEYMQEDYAHGHGVEIAGDLGKYFLSRDLTLNEVIATDSQILATKECLLDTARKIIRMTDYEKDINEQGVSDKMMSKVLRFYSEAIQTYDDAIIADPDNYDFEEYFISPFWLSLQLDRAYEKGPHIAEQFVRTLQKNNQIPLDIEDAQEAVRYLSDLLADDYFYFRHAPTKQFELEDKWVEALDQLPSRQGFSKRGKLKK